MGQWGLQLGTPGVRGTDVDEAGVGGGMGCDRRPTLTPSPAREKLWVVDALLACALHLLVRRNQHLRRPLPC